MAQNDTASDDAPAHNDRLPEGMDADDLPSPMEDPDLAFLHPGKEYRTLDEAGTEFRIVDYHPDADETPEGEPVAHGYVEVEVKDGKTATRYHDGAKILAEVRRFELGEAEPDSYIDYFDAVTERDPWAIPTDDGEQTTPDAEAEEVGETVTLTVYYTTFDESSPGFETARDLRTFADPHDVDEETFAAAYKHATTATIDLEDVEFGADDTDDVLDYVYSRLQGARTDEELGYDGTGMRSVGKGDIIAVDGEAYLVGEGFGFPHVGRLSDLSPPPDHDADSDEENDDDDHDGPDGNSSGEGDSEGDGELVADGGETLRGVYDSANYEARQDGFSDGDRVTLVYESPYSGTVVEVEGDAREVSATSFRLELDDGREWGIFGESVRTAEDSRRASGQVDAKNGRTVGYVEELRVHATPEVSADGGEVPDDSEGDEDDGMGPHTCDVCGDPTKRAFHPSPADGADSYVKVVHGYRDSTLYCSLKCAEKGENGSDSEADDDLVTDGGVEMSPGPDSNLSPDDPVDELPRVGRERAKSLRSRGFRTIRDVAEAHASKLLDSGTIGDTTAAVVSMHAAAVIRRSESESDDVEDRDGELVADGGEPGPDELEAGDAYELTNGTMLVIQGGVPADEAPESARDTPLYQAKLRREDGTTKTMLYGAHDIEHALDAGATYVGVREVFATDPFWCAGCERPHKSSEEYTTGYGALDAPVCSYGCRMDVWREQRAEKISDERGQPMTDGGRPSDADENDPLAPENYEAPEIHGVIQDGVQAKVEYVSKRSGNLKEAVVTVDYVENNSPRGAPTASLFHGHHAAGDRDLYVYLGGSYDPATHGESPPEGVEPARVWTQYTVNNQLTGGIETHEQTLGRPIAVYFPEGRRYSVDVRGLTDEELADFEAAAAEVLEKHLAKLKSNARREQIDVDVSEAGRIERQR